MAGPQSSHFTLAPAPPPTLGCRSSFQWAELAPHFPQVPSGTKQQQSSESQALCKKQKAKKPWVWTVGSHILACSLLSAPGPSCPPQEAQRANVQVRVTVSQTPSPQGKDCSRNILSTCACFFHLHCGGSGHRPWSWTAWGEKPAPYLCSNPDKAITHSCKNVGNNIHLRDCLSGLNALTSIKDLEQLLAYV